jgi:hypothetical protein
MNQKTKKIIKDNLILLTEGKLPENLKELEKNKNTLLELSFLLNNLTKKDNLLIFKWQNWEIITKDRIPELTKMSKQNIEDYIILNIIKTNDFQSALKQYLTQYSIEKRNLTLNQILKNNKI